MRPVSVSDFSHLAARPLVRDDAVVYRVSVARRMLDWFADRVDGALRREISSQEAFRFNAKVLAAEARAAELDTRYVRVG